MIPHGADLDRKDIQKLHVIRKRDFTSFLLKKSQRVLASQEDTVQSKGTATGRCKCLVENRRYLRRRAVISGVCRLPACIVLEMLFDGDIGSDG